MTQARRERTTSAGPSGWMILLGLMVLALIIAWASKGCGDSNETTPAAQSPTTSTSTAPSTAAVDVVDQINATIEQAGGVQFLTGKSDLTTASRTTLNSVAAILKANPSVKAEVRGYTDDEGDASKNLQLSQQRAQAVVDYLVQQGGIATTRLSAKGLGEESPLVPNTSEENRKKNRRVAFGIG